MANASKFNQFVEDLGLGVHNFNADQLNVALYQDTASITAASGPLLGNLSNEVTGTGYTTKGKDITNTWSETTGTATCGASSPAAWTAGASDWDSIQYAVVFNEDATGPDELVMYWDNGSTIDLTADDTFTFTITTSIFTLA